MEPSSRERILQSAEKNKPQAAALPDITFFENSGNASVEKFADALTAIGGTVYHIDSYSQLLAQIHLINPEGGRIHSTIPEVTALLNQHTAQAENGHSFADVEVAIIKAHLAVAENGAVWITDDLLPHRALPFITQHLAVVINKNDICATMHQAYLHISSYKYQYAAFIAGPSKTADIEQSLVIGAHGSRSMTVFVM